MQLFEVQGQSHSRRRSDSCMGWHCLNSATHFGIIFSIVVIFLILSMVWMYCLGRAKIFRKQTKSVHTPGRRRVRLQHRNSNSATQPTPHMIQQTPVFGYGIAQQPPIYLFPGPQFLTTQPLGVMAAHIHSPVSAPLPQGAQGSRHLGTTTEAPPTAQDSRQEPDLPPNNRSPSHHPTWWQRLHMAFNLPVGVASTIASSPSPEPLQSTSTNANHPATDPNVERPSLQLDGQIEGRELELPNAGEDETSSMICNLDTSSDSAQSIRTDVATVHSDDFDLTPQH